MAGFSLRIRVLFQGHSGCYQNSVPFDCRTKMGYWSGLLSVRRSCLLIPFHMAFSTFPLELESVSIALNLSDFFLLFLNPLCKGLTWWGQVTHTYGEGITQDSHTSAGNLGDVLRLLLTSDFAWFSCIYLVIEWKQGREKPINRCNKKRK